MQLTACFLAVRPQMVKDVAAARGLTEMQVRRALDDSPLTAKQALKLGLVDGADYRDAVEARIKVVATSHHVM